MAFLGHVCVSCNHCCLQYATMFVIVVQVYCWISYVLVDGESVDFEFNCICGDGGVEVDDSGHGTDIPATTEWKITLLMLNVDGGGW